MIENNNILTCEDIYGRPVTIDIRSLGNVTLFGMDLTTITRFRHFYLLKGGTLPITDSSVKSLLGRYVD